jgi:hypothetical protein
VSGWSTCRSCHQRIWWGAAPFDSSRNWPFDDQDEQIQHFDTCAAIARVVDASGTRHRVSTCRACGIPVWWDTTFRGKRRPMNVNLDGTTSAECHFDTCLGQPSSAEAEPVAAQPFGIYDIDPWLAQLGLRQPVTLEEITSAFRGLAMRHHPDMGGNASDFIRIKLAFDRCKELMGAAA